MAYDEPTLKEAPPPNGCLSEYRALLTGNRQLQDETLGLLGKTDINIKAEKTVQLTSEPAQFPVPSSQTLTHDCVSLWQVAAAG